MKSKTPKVTLYTKYAKVMLMENSPNADLEVCFYDGRSEILYIVSVFTEVAEITLFCVNQKTTKQINFVM